MPYAELLFVSAKTGQRLNKIYDMIDMVIESQTMRIPTGVLNEYSYRSGCNAAATFR